MTPFPTVWITGGQLGCDANIEVILKISKKLRKFKICIEQLKCTSIQAFLSSSNLFKHTQTYSMILYSLCISYSKVEFGITVQSCFKLIVLT